MSAPDHPIRGALSLAAGLALLTAPVIAVPLLVAGGWVPTIAGAALSWGVVRRLAKAQDGAWLR
ncbi:hypothetical protein N866_13535 [Actinotalea ferrariae CF5-4]|uniref:Uncharacterized protein n=1 Tax=Actinotalea ferrariae CF5-4 TaxID=948458 RepID=A0A021VT14_9CELL|nr:hypothetical protein [Actinotalea ferrariae]EYR64268.1 hypothetical protein N866_13535 [Actinotalea ferrariae CF5-4]